jgi:hypothetical protein
VSSPYTALLSPGAGGNRRIHIQFCETESRRVCGAPQLLQLEQHREHAFELSVEMNLVAGEAFEPVGIDGFAICLSAD